MPRKKKSSKSHKERFDAALAKRKAASPELQRKLPSSVEKIERLKNWVSFDDANPEIKEVVVGGISAHENLVAMGVSENGAKGGTTRGTKYLPRNRWIRFLADKERKENPGLRNTDIAARVREKIIQYEDEISFEIIPGSDLVANIDQVVRLCFSNDQALSADRIRKIIRD